jgi:hypothetical protein
MLNTALHAKIPAKKHSSKRQTVSLTLWVSPSLKAALTHMAIQEGLSISSIGTTGLEEWVHQKLHKQHEALLYPVIRQIIREELQTFGNRIVFFLMRIAFASEQARILITNVLDRLLRREGVPEHTFTTLVDQSNRMARRNIIQKTPQVQSLLDEWEGLFHNTREEGTRTSNG